ncbi:hypothetical protein CEXT_687031 [Caerostris extrusa]|uniref:Uncharacterized protein n=1 Tax=Caerostris extrusa TaxID=172846 RepID=A0AAV4MG16_CAEEX|nr:hypothetical protein CEXT_687031 [Caerostris extrusa]
MNVDCVWSFPSSTKKFCLPKCFLSRLTNLALPSRRSSPRKFPSKEALLIKLCYFLAVNLVDTFSLSLTRRVPN